MTGTGRNIETSYATPSRDLGPVRRALRVVLVLAIVLPLGYLLFYSVTDLRRREAQASEGVDRLARVAQEHALKIIDMNAELEARIAEGLDRRPGSDIAHDQRRVYRWLAQLAGAYPQVSALSVFDNTGVLLATSRIYPAPAVSIGKREDFRGARGAWPADYFSVPIHGVVSGLDIFTTSIARLDDHQAFLGTVAVALKRAYFADFYRDLIGSNEAVDLSLYRRDGTLLVRYPGVAADTRQAPLDAHFAQALRDNTLVGQILTGSGVDQPHRILAFRRVDDYPLYVSASVDVQSITDAWLSHMLAVMAMIILPSAAVCGLVLFALRRLMAEERAWEHWHTEFSMHAAS